MPNLRSSEHVQFCAIIVAAVIVITIRRIRHREGRKSAGVTMGMVIDGLRRWRTAAPLNRCRRRYEGTVASIHCLFYTSFLLAYWEINSTRICFTSTHCLLAVGQVEVDQPGTALPYSR